VIARDEIAHHDEVWLLLPWLANGRLAQAEREHAQVHVRRCSECERELAVQHLMCNAFTEPDRVTYAPGPSFRKLMDRIGADTGAVAGDTAKTPRSMPAPGRAVVPLRGLAARLGHVSLWRPPGVAWAASFLILFGLTGLLATAYRWSEPAYRTRSDPTTAPPTVLHIALDRALTIGEVERMLKKSGARIVEGPDNTGVFGVTPVGDSGRSAADVGRELWVLSARLRADSRVLWVQPLERDDSPADQRAPASPEN
jgi:hypothetical protein